MAARSALIIIGKSIPGHVVPRLQSKIPARRITSVRSLATTVPPRSAASDSSPPSLPDHATPDPSRPTHFGYETVTEAEKQVRVADVFTSVAESYDRMNDLMSFGWHRIWKDHFVASLNPGFSPLAPGSDPRTPQHILDVAGGTGDIAFRMVHSAHVVNRNPGVRVTVSDINPAMLRYGQQRASSLPAGQQAALRFVECNAENLRETKPLQAAGPSTSTAGIPDDSVDLYTVAFGIRNFSNIPAALREAHRVLRPGGVFACLEFSKVDRYPLFNSLYKTWSFGVIPLIGQLVAGDRDSYQYLVESIERFPSQAQFRNMILDAGFVVGGQGYEDLTGGVAAIHKGMKPK